MLEVEAKNTKDKILITATKLFAKHGFAGTSIRDIAKEAEVNLSAVNYHFENKQNLYFHVFERNVKWMSDAVDNLGKDPKIDTKELGLQTYRFFINNKSGLLNTFKFFINDDIDFAVFSNEVQAEKFGPPGQDAFLEKITKDVGEEIPFEGRYWAMKMIFSELVHFALKMSTKFMNEKCKQDPRFTDTEIERSLGFMIEAVLSYLKQNPQNWATKH